MSEPARLSGNRLSGNRLSGIVLAAGAGTRFGRPKAQVELDGVRLLDRAVSLLRAAGCDEVIAVLRSEEDVPGVHVVLNPEPERGMGSSLRLGLAHCTGQLAVVTLVDTPGIRVAAVRAVAERVREGAPVAIATYNGRRGHPVAFDRGVWPAVAEQAEGDQGARGFLRTHPELVIEVASEGDPGDIDTPADLAAWPDRQA